MILVDSSVLIDVIDGDPAWEDWSNEQLQRYEPAGLAVNPIIFAEVAAGMDDPSLMDSYLPRSMITRLPLPYGAAARAASAARRYGSSDARAADGRARLILPDFYIGAHAEEEGLGLLTRDKRFEKAFPTVNVILPTP